MASYRPQIKVIGTGLERFKRWGEEISPSLEFSMAWTKAWSNAGEHSLGPCTPFLFHPFDSCLIDVEDISAPSSMDVGDGQMFWIKEQTGLTISMPDEQREIRKSGGNSISMDNGWQRTVEDYYLRRMVLEWGDDRTNKGGLSVVYRQCGGEMGVHKTGMTKGREWLQ
jgi:hypothetical protein